MCGFIILRVGPKNNPNGNKAPIKSHVHFPVKNTANLSVTTPDDITLIGNGHDKHVDELSQADRDMLKEVNSENWHLQ